MSAAIAPDALAGLRNRLVALRADVLGQLAAADHINPGHLALLPGITDALAALDAELPVEAEPAERAVLVDDGAALQLISYAGADRATAVPLTSMRALGLAAELIQAATRRLAR